MDATMEPTTNTMDTRELVDLASMKECTSKLWKDTRRNRKKMYKNFYDTKDNKIIKIYEKVMNVLINMCKVCFHAPIRFYF